MKNIIALNKIVLFEILMYTDFVLLYNKFRQVDKTVLVSCRVEHSPYLLHCLQTRTQISITSKTDTDIYSWFERRNIMHTSSREIDKLISSGTRFNNKLGFDGLCEKQRVRFLWMNGFKKVVWMNNSLIKNLWRHLCTLHSMCLYNDSSRNSKV